MRLSGGKKTVILTNYYNKAVLLPLCDNKCAYKNMAVCSQSMLKK
jgi:hypothetical protein